MARHAPGTVWSVFSAASLFIALVYANSPGFSGEISKKPEKNLEMAPVSTVSALSTVGDPELKSRFQQTNLAADVDSKVAAEDQVYASTGFHLVALAQSTGASSTATTAVDELATRARAAIELFEPISPAEMIYLHGQLAAAVQRLDVYLKAQGQNGDDWRKYLHFDALTRLVQAGERADRSLLTQVWTHFVANHSGLELAPFTDVALALRVYLDRLEARSATDAKADFKERLLAVADGFERPTMESQRQMLSALSALDRSGRAPNLVRAARARLASPNLLVTISGRFVNIGIARPVDETSPLRDNINGARMSGCGRTVGQFQARLIASPGPAMIETYLTGQTFSKTVTAKGPVFVYADGVSQLFGRKVMFLTARGITTQSAEVDLKTNTRVTGIATTKQGVVDRLIKKIAQKRVPQEKAAGERVAVARAKRQFSRRLDEQAADGLVEANRGFEERFRLPLVRLGAFPEQLHTSTTTDELNIAALLTGAARFGAPTPPPALSASAGDLVIRLHETAINNLAATVLGGRTLNQDQMDKLVLDLTGKPPERSPEEAKEPWSITFPEHQPVTLKVEDSTVSVTVRGTRFTAGKRKLEAMNVTARYQLSQDAGRLKATRVGTVEIFPPDFVPGQQQLSTGQTVVRRMIQRRLDKHLLPELLGDGLVLKENYAGYGPLPFTQVTAQQGWLALGWRLPEAKRSAAPLVAGADSPAIVDGE